MEILKKGKKVSDVVTEFSVHTNMVMKWEKKLFEGAVDTFKKSQGRI